MQQILKSTGQTVLIFAGLFAAQWVIPYIFLTIAAVGYGGFQLSTGNKKSGWAWLIAGVVLGVNAWVFDHYFRGR
jgi:hypothetical protein